MSDLIRFETFEHGADIGIRGIGDSLENAFIGVATAMFSIMVVDLSKVFFDREIKIDLDAVDLVSLMVFWLNRLITQADISKIFFCKFHLEIEQRKDEYQLKSINYGGNLQSLEYLGVEVKGVTFSQARVVKQNDLWIAQCIVDV